MSRMISQYRLTRTGDAPITFSGELVAESQESDQDGIRTYTVRIYRRGKVLAWSAAIDTTWDGERPHQWAGIVFDESLVALALRSFDPVPPRYGWPPGDKYAKRQADFLERHRSMYQSVVSSALSQAGITAVVPFDGDASNVIWLPLKDVPDLGVPCLLKLRSGTIVKAVAQESARVAGQLSWNVGATIAYDTPEIMQWGYVD